MQRLAIFCLFASFLFCYLEWPTDNHIFVYEIEFELLFDQKLEASDFIHPMLLLPLLGQLMAWVALLTPQPKKWMVFSGIAMMGLLVLMLVIVGVFGENWKIVLATVPFWAAAGWCWREFRGVRKVGDEAIS